jgi:hypothetical protein
MDVRLQPPTVNGDLKSSYAQQQNTSCILGEKSNMKISRRKFLEAGTLLTATAGISLTTPSVIKGQTEKDTSFFKTKRPYENPNDLLSNLTKLDFERQMKTKFVFFSPTLGAAGLTLTQVEDLARNKDGTEPNGDEGFSLLFRSKQANITQDTYQVTHASLGAFQMFIVPVCVSQSSSSCYYEAVINRLYY